MAMTVNGVDQRVSSAVGAPGQPSFEFMFAPLLIGVLLNALLFGVFIVQAHSYFRLYKTDFGWIRYFVYYLILMETINTVCDVGLIYEPLIMLHDSPSVFINAPRFLAADPVVTTLISTPTQLFMAWRIRRVTRSNYLSGVVALLAFASSVGGIAATIGVAQQREFAKFPLIAGSLTLWLTSTAFADMFITAFLVDFLWKNKTGFRTQTDSVTDRIIFFTVQTGMLTSVAAIVDASLFFIFPHARLMFIWDSSLSKLYSICLIATLNARHEWNDLLQDIPSASLEMNASKAGEPNPNAIIRLRAATDVHNLQLYIPSEFPSPRNSTMSSTAMSARRQTPPALYANTRGKNSHGWIPCPLPLVMPGRSHVSAKSTASHHISGCYGEGEEDFALDGSSSAKGEGGKAQGIAA